LKCNRVRHEVLIEKLAVVEVFQHLLMEEAPKTKANHDYHVSLTHNHSPCFSCKYPELISSISDKENAGNGFKTRNVRFVPLRCDSRGKDPIKIGCRRSSAIKHPF
jgi:hypothetical protein